MLIFGAAEPYPFDTACKVETLQHIGEARILKWHGEFSPQLRLVLDIVSSVTSR